MVVVIYRHRPFQTYLDLHHAFWIVLPFLVLAEADVEGYLFGIQVSGLEGEAVSPTYV